MNIIQAIRQDWEGYQVWFIFLGEEASCRLSIYNDNPKDAIISDLFVHENFRNQGLAGKLLEYCEGLAKKKGCDSISLRSDDDNWVREWYKKIGFEVESSQVWLKKKLPQKIYMDNDEFDFGHNVTYQER